MEYHKEYFSGTYFDSVLMGSWQIFPLIAIKIIPLNTIDLWIMGIKWGFAKGIYSHLYYHTIYHSFSHLPNGIFYAVPILFNNIINNKINNYNKNKISVYY